MRRLLAFAVLVVAATAAATSQAAADDGRVNYRPPVDAPITDHFRKPAHNWNAGNRGIDYTTVPGTPVRAAADGEVTFAGQVGGSLHVVLLHADGLRTSYSFLQATSVHRGDVVKQGDVIGTSGTSLHPVIDARAETDRPPPRRARRRPRLVERQRRRARCADRPSRLRRRRRHAVLLSRGQRRRVAVRLDRYARRSAGRRAPPARAPR